MAMHFGLTRLLTLQIAPIRRQPQLTVVPKQESPPTEAVFVLSPIAWVDHTGARQRAARFTVAKLPVQLLPLAREHNAIAPLSDPRLKTHGAQSLPLPEWRHCLDLSTGAEPQQVGNVAPIKPMFEPMDRGRPYAISHHEPQIAAGGTRKSDPTDEETR
jgi:hypothetical protein